jgi:hypothetical protein
MERADLAVAVIAGRGFAVKRVAQTLCVSRSQLPRSFQSLDHLRSRYCKGLNADLLAPLRSLVDERLTTATGVSRR